ncbi:ATP-binding protein [Actinacidiphila soli]|uniref:ATP-binding protein n=1 Tax=Actinacidiphila soli TaxID=2487275 RepID=UPI0013E3A546|nr:ATP-binding protein [Actinacidiphila soli]
MPIYRANEPHRQCVLPFEAEPQALAGLRRAVGRQLAAWDVSGITDDAQLAVSELAANVIRHVGEGSAATLVIEDAADRLRIEMHDTSPVLPRCRQASPFEESGRGLGLVAAVSDSWFAHSTVAGKAVCCEFSNPRVVSRPPAGHERVERGMTMIELYALQWRSSESRPLRSTPAVAETAAEMITDLLYWLSDRGCDPDDILDRAQMHFEAELLKKACGSSSRRDS